MAVLDWLRENATIINLAATLCLVGITAVYVYLTKRMVGAAETASKLALDPVIGIEVRGMLIGEEFGEGRRNLGVELTLTNVGRAPAIEVLVDGEFVLQYARISDEDTIPSRFEPEVLPFVQPGQATQLGGPHFGNALVLSLIDDFREFMRLNDHRIATDPTREAFTASRLRIIVYYRNSVGQHFESTYETHVHMGEGTRTKIPGPDERGVLSQIYVPRPKFHAGPISKAVIEAGLATRNRKRDLCGW